jgi:hypothetical protein
MYSNVVKSLMMSKLMLCLFQENKSYGIKTPSKMAKGKKTMTLASAAANKSAAALAHMSEELGREEAAPIVNR